MSVSYHDRPEWSYSQMKLILDHGIDYAVAAKRKIIQEKFGTAVDLGELVHMIVLGGEAKNFVVSPYDNFFTKEAKAWRDARRSEGKTIIRKNEYESFVPIANNIKAHPRSAHLITAPEVKHEVEVYSTINDVAVRSKLDAMQKLAGGGIALVDIKTTNFFDRWAKDKYFAIRQHYDLQAALYLTQACNATKTSQAFGNFWFCVAETIFPYRVQYHLCSAAFLDSGLDKLNRCLTAIKEFGDREPNFLIYEVNELGDWSL